MRGENDKNTKSAVIFINLNDESPYVGIEVFDNVENFSPKEWWEAQPSYPIKGDQKFIDKGLFVVAGKDAQAFKASSGFEATHYIVPRDSSVFLVSSFLSDTIMQKILSTFKFTK